jgi:SAM-dependent methyltransferase
VTARSSHQATPLRLGSVADFTRVEALLRGVQFDEASVCRILGIASMADLGSVRPDQVDLTAAGSTTLALLIRLFLLIEQVPQEEVARGIGPDALTALVALDLLGPAVAAGGAEAYGATVLLYPVAGLLIVSDRHENPDRSPFVPSPDVVFPAIFAGTQRFLQILPRTPAEDVLDLCAGTGIGALALSRHAKRAVAADITPRAAHFAEFNRLLNRCHNVEVAQGDLYQAVDGQTFDRIVAHPPYVPAATDTQVFRDAGETGEAILRRVIEGLPRFLRPGGAFYAVCAGWDAKDAPFEERVRQWLGAAHEEFDVLFAMHHQMSPGDVARGLAERSKGDDPARVADWGQVFGKAGVERRVYGALVVDRPAGLQAGVRRRAITRRLQLSPLTDGASFAWLLHWLRWRETIEARGELGCELLRIMPCLSPHLRVNVAYVPQADGLTVADVVLETDRPFAAATRIDPWMFALVARFDGAHAAEAVYESARDAAQLAEGFGPSDYTALVAMLVERGYVEVDDAFLGQ